VGKVINRPPNCGDCGAKPGELHMHGCDVERCPRCGHQAIGCGCIYEVCGMDREKLEKDHPDIYNNGPTDEMYAKWDSEWEKRRMPWTGEWPGVAECQEYGFYAYLIPYVGWPACATKDAHLEATEDLTRLVTTCRWDQEKQRFVKP
jgi:hypothetical protein